MTEEAAHVTPFATLLRFRKAIDQGHPRVMLVAPLSGHFATLWSKLRPYLKRPHLQPGVGHYGVFSGRKWEGQIYPIVNNVILASD